MANDDTIIVTEVGDKMIDTKTQKHWSKSQEWCGHCKENGVGSVMLRCDDGERYDPEDIRDDYECPTCNARYGCTKASRILIRKGKDMSCNGCGNCACKKNPPDDTYDVYNNIGWSDFALSRHKPGTGNSYYKTSDSDVVNAQRAVQALVAANWKHRIPGDGETDLSRKVLVPVDPSGFVCPTIDVKKLEEFPYPSFMIVNAEAEQRQEGEDYFISNYVNHSELVYFDLVDLMDKAEHVKIVLYSAEALTENGGERSTNCDWEIVCIIASPVENEPMEPLAMSRNMLEKPGGTKSDYTAKEFAESIYYWSQKVRVK